MRYDLSRVTLSVILLTILVQGVCYAQLPNYLENAIEKIRSANEQTRMEGYNAVLECRRQYIGTLMEVAGDTTAPEWGRAKAMWLLGAFRAVEAIDLLAQEIKMTVTIKQSFFEAIYRPLGPRAPAREALVEIGRPVIPKMTDLIATSQDPEVRDAARSIIRGVLILMPVKVRNKFLEGQFHEAVDVASAKDIEDATNRLVEESLKTSKQSAERPTEKGGKTKSGALRMPSVEKLKDSNAEIQEDGFREIAYFKGLVATELSHKIINDSEGLPPSKRLAWDLLDKLGALNVGWEEQVYK